MKRVAAAAALILFAGALFFMDFPKRFAKEKEVIEIVALGDSTTAGTPAFFSPRERPPAGQGDEESQYAYWAMLAHPEWHILNRGVRGQRTDQIRERMQYDVLREEPDVMILIAGVNDVYQGFPEEHIKNNLKSMYDTARGAGIRVMAGTILPFDIATPEQADKINNVNDWIRSQAKENGYGLCDTYKALEDPKRPGKLIRSWDQIHPDVEGYKLMGEAITEALEKWI